MLTREEVIFESPPVKLPVGFNKNGVKLNNGANMNKNVINHNNNIVRMTEMRTKSGACVKYVCSKVTLYYNSRIELKWRRALHHCQTCDYGVGKGETVPCGAIHYGMCLPVVDKYSLPQKTWQSAKRPVAGLARSGVNTVSSPAVSGVSLPTSHPSSHTSKIFIQVGCHAFLSTTFVICMIWFNNWIEDI